MIEEETVTADDISLNKKINERVNRMLKCLLWSSEKKCKYCKDVDACIYLIEVVFACRTSGIQ